MTDTVTVEFEYNLGEGLVIIQVEATVKWMGSKPSFTGGNLEAGPSGGMEITKIEMLDSEGDEISGVLREIFVRPWCKREPITVEQDILDKALEKANEEN